MATSSRRREVLDVPLPLDHSAGNQSLQVHASLRAAILVGRLAPGTRLPSSRALAGQLGVGRNAVVIAYEHLQGDGLVESTQGAGTYVAMLPKGGAQSAGADALLVETLPRGPLAIGRTHGDPSLLQRLAGAIRRRITTASEADLGYGDPRGSFALRKQLAAHLAATRGILCDPACVLITSGTQQGLRLCIDALLQAGDAVWMEDPGYPTARRTLQSTGMRVVPVAVDAEGFDARLFGPGRHGAEGGGDGAWTGRTGLCEVAWSAPIPSTRRIIPMPPEITDLIVSPSAERNKQPIAEILMRVLPTQGDVLEVSSGTGQHVVHFAQAMPHIRWQPAEKDANGLKSIARWLAETNRPNVNAPIRLDVHDEPWPVSTVAAVVCINMIHIAAPSATEALLRGAANVLRSRGVLFLYGPYRREGRHTSPGNEAFDQSLKAQNPQWGIRDLEQVTALAKSCGFELQEICEMPANNLSVIFRKR